MNSLLIAVTSTLSAVIAIAAYLFGFWEGFRKGKRKERARCRDIAFSIEAKYAPTAKDTDCCKCDKSHAKADGAAEVLDAL